jgi:hypothetical protein
VRELKTYTLQRQSPVALRLLDTITVSFLVLVVVGMAVIARERSFSGLAHFLSSNSVRAQLRTFWTWP